MRSLTTFPALFLLLLLLMAVTPVSIAWNANRPGQGPDPLSLPAVAAGDNATVLLTTVLQPSSHQDGDEVVADPIPAVDATAAYPDRVPGDDVTDVPSPDQPLKASDVASLSSDVDDGTEEDVSSSTSPVEDLTVVAPSLLSSENVDPSPQKSTSDDDAGSSNSTESLSAAQLKTNLDVAEALQTTAKGEFDTATKALEGKQQAALDANQQLTEKKQKWAELEGLAKEKEKDWDALEEVARLTEKAYTKAKNRLDSATQALPDEQAKLDAYPQNITDAKAALEVVKERPTRLRALEATRKAKVDGRSALELSVQPAGVLYKEEERLRELWESADNLAKIAQDRFNTNKCEKAENEPTCRTIIEHRNDYKSAADSARGKHESANTALETAENEVAYFDLNLLDMDNEILALKADCEQHRLDRDVISAGNAITRLESGQKTQKGEVDYWKEEKRQAEEDEPIKASTRDEATAKMAGGKPPEAVAARSAASHAFIDTDRANKTKIAKDKEVTEAQNALTQAESSYKDAQAVVARLTNRYDVQKRKEDEAQRGSLGLIMGCIGGVLLLVGLGAAGYLVWRKKGRRGEDHKESKHRASTADTAKKTSNSLDN